MESHSESVLRPAVRLFALLLLAVAAVPDVLPYAGLKNLIGDRFGLGDAEAQLFAIAALFGALCAVPLLTRARRSSPRSIFALAALAQSAVIACMALPVDWSVLLLLRGVQGAVDLILLVTLTTLVAASSRSTGRGFGAAGASVLFGLAFGLIAGGILAAQAAALVFPVAAGVSLCLALAAWVLPATPMEQAARPRKERRDRQIIAGAAFAASDRMINGMLTISLPFLMVMSFGAQPSTIGLILAVPLIACAVGGYFSGMLVDRIGAIQARLFGVPLQAIGVALIVFSGGSVPLLVFGTLGLALGATLLLPTSLVIGVGGKTQEVAVDAVGGIQALGQAGHLTGVLLVFGLTLLTGVVTPLAIAALLLLYLLWNGVWLLQARALAHAASAEQAQQSASQRPVMVSPTYARLRRQPKPAIVIEPLGDITAEPPSGPLSEENTACRSTSMSASKTAKS